MRSGSALGGIDAVQHYELMFEEHLRARSGGTPSTALDSATHSSLSTIARAATPICSPS
jgi:hypothetical protein